MVRVSLFDQITNAGKPAQDSSDGVDFSDLIPDYEDFSTEAQLILESFEEEGVKPLGGETSLVAKKIPTLQSRLDQEAPQCHVSPSKLPKPSGRRHTVREDLTVDISENDDFEGSHPVLQRILHPERPSAALPELQRRQSSMICVRKPVVPTCSTLRVAIDELEEGLLALKARPLRTVKRVVQMADPVQVKDFCLINKVNIAEAVRARRVRAPKIPCAVQKAVTREKHRREVEGRRDAVLNSKLSDGWTAQQKVRQAEYETKLHAQRAQAAWRQVRWTGLLLVLRFPRILDSKHQGTLELLYLGALTKARDTLLNKFIPLWRACRKRKLKKNFFVITRVVCAVVVWKRFMRDAVANRVVDFLKRYTTDTTLAMKRFHRVTRRAQMIAIQCLRRKRAYHRMILRWFMLCEAWLILQNVNSYAQHLPNRDEVLASAKTMRCFMLKPGHRIRFEHRLVISALPPLATYRQFYRSDIPAPRPGLTIHEEYVSQHRIKTLIRKLRNHVYIRFSRPRIRARTAKIHERKELLRSVMHDTQKRQAAQRQLLPNPPNRFAKAESKRTLMMVVSAVVNPLRDFEMLPPALSALRLAPEAREKLVHSLYNQFISGTSGDEIQDRIAYTLQMRLRRFFRTGEDVKAPEFKKKELRTLENEDEMVHRIRRALTESLMERKVSNMMT